MGYVGQDDNETWEPDWVVHPGEILAEHLEAREWSQAEFARRTGLTTKLISTIINGQNPVSAESAIKFERVLELKANVWTNLQSTWDLHAARNKKTLSDEEVKFHLSRFPIAELRQRGVISSTSDIWKTSAQLFSFLGIGDFESFSACNRSLAVHHRQSTRSVTSDEHIASWLLLGEMKARKADLPKYDAIKFATALDEIVTLTVFEPEVFEPKMKSLCKKAGVALILEKPIKKTCLYGSARWFDDDHAIIQMSLRMKTNDHFWWTFFHEAAHILLHKGMTFVDDPAASGDELETEADTWAEEHLVGHDDFAAFKSSRPRTNAKIRAFAKRKNLHPGIVVGMLQHAGTLPYSYLNGLKVKFDWAN